MQDLLVEWFGTSGATAARYVIAFVVVLVLLLGLRWILRSFSGGGVLRARSGRQPRLAVMDVAAVDPRRRLVLVRRDNVEHLLLIGGPTDIVVEPTIIKGVPVGTMGRFPRANGEAPAEGARKAAREEPAPTAVAPTPARPAVAAEPPAPRIPAEPVAPAIAAPERPESLEPVPPRREVMPPLVGPAPAAPVALDTASEDAAPVPPPRSRATPTVRPSEPQKPYVPPAPNRPAARTEPVATAPIVAAPQPAPRADAPPEKTEETGEFDDLAKRLDDALRLDVEAGPGRVEPSVREEPLPPVERPAPPARPARVQTPIQPPAPKPPVDTAPPVRPTRPLPPIPPRPAEAGDRSVAPPIGDKPAAPERARPIPPVQAPPRPTPPVQPAGEERPAPVQRVGTASAWFRPRSAPVTPPPVAPVPAPDLSSEASEPVVAAPALPVSDHTADRIEPDRIGLRPLGDAVEADAPVPAVEPDRIARSPGGAPVLPAVEAIADQPGTRAPAAVVDLSPANDEPRRDLDSALADDLARILVEPDEPSPTPASAANDAGLDLWADSTEPEPEPAPPPAPVVDTAPAGPSKDHRDPDYLSLEDEMARLLDELAGDIGKNGKSR